MKNTIDHSAPVRVLIFGHKEFSQLVSSVLPTFAGQAIFIIVDALIGSAEEVKQQVKHHQPDVILSGGANAVYLQSCLDIPVVSTKVTDADIIQTIEKASSVSKHIALVSFNPPSAVVPVLEKSLGVTIQEENYTRTDQAREIFHIVSKKPDITIVGASLVCGLAAQNNISSFLFYTAESCKASLADAIEQGKQYKALKTGYAIQDWLMQQSKTPIILTDHNDDLVMLNQAAKQDLKPTLDFEVDLHDLIHQQDSQKMSDGECNINGTDWWYHRDEVLRDTLVLNVYQLYRKKPKTDDMLATNKSTYKLAFRSQAIDKVMAQVDSFCTSPSNVLVFGESGTGKELIAREVHKRGPFSQGKFVALNCSAIPTELFEGELFGHQDGAYTGSKRGGRKGLIEEAQSGVLFLDEISELALDQQSKLLRFLQERMYRPLGANEEKSVQLKLVAASNKSLKEMVEEGTFRQDLYFRLNVFNITLPPLRSRPEDILCIAQYKLDQFIESYQIRFESTQILTRIQHVLTNYTWPGNVRELENVLERLVAFLHSQNDLEQLETCLQELAPELFFDKHFEQDTGRLKNKELEMVADAMVQFSGDKQQVAKYLGLSQTTLWRRLKHIKNN